MTRFFFWLFAVWPVLVWGQKPNMLFIISDDQSPRSIGGEQPGGQDPELGSLGPTRHPLQPLLQPRLVVGSGMRGQPHHADHGTKRFRAPKNKPYLDKWANSRGALAVEDSTEAKLWPEVFREAGYDTFLTGKWHNNHHSALKGFSQAKGIAKGMYETFDPSGSKSQATTGQDRATTTGLPGIGNSPAIGLLSFGTS